MKIQRFVATKVHDYLDFDIAFFPDLTFLTGINGSGKTSVVNGITALITPSLLMLANTTYKRMEVEIIHDERVINIWSTRSTEIITLGSSELLENLEITILPKEVFEAMPAYRVRDEKIKYYREQEAAVSTHPLLKLIKSLPTPMFLDIDRRIDDSSDERYIPHSIRRRTQNIFSSSLSRSLLEAISLAEISFRRVQARQRSLTDRLRKNIIQSAIQYDTPNSTRVQFPRLTESYLEAKKNQVKTILQSLGLSENEVGQQLDPYFSRLQLLSKQLPVSENIAEVIASELKGTDDKPEESKYVANIQETKSQESETLGFSEKSLNKLSAAFEWMVNKPQFDRIMMIARHAERHIKESRKLNKPINDYLDTVNKFLVDSGKELQFDETGNLRVKVHKYKVSDITALSSGESQLVVILTHLTFNPSANLANVFIIDEPELSLHVRWQELFVSSLRTAAPKLQLILATHSPSIILEDIPHCVDLGGEETSGD